MTELSCLLNTAIEKNSAPELMDLLAQALQLSEQQAEENQRLEQIIHDIRERDASKKCLCRGKA